jgi:hypothetical protein
MGQVIKMQPVSELNGRAPEFRALTNAGVRDLASYRGQWLALMYCPRAACGLRADCLGRLDEQAREINAMGGQLLVLHPALANHDKDLERPVRQRRLRSFLVGTPADARFLQAYQLREEDGLGHGITGLFIIDPQGKLRAAARHTACAPVFANEIATQMRTAIEKFGQSGMRLPEMEGKVLPAADVNYGCVEWFQY